MTPTKKVQPMCGCPGRVKVRRAMVHVRPDDRHEPKSTRPKRRPSGRDIFKRLRARGLGEMAQFIANAHGCGPHEMLGRRRRSGMLAARRELYRALRSQGMSFQAIGRLLDRDACTVQVALFDEERLANRRSKQKLAQERKAA